MDVNMIRHQSYYCDAGSHYGCQAVRFAGTAYLTQDEYAQAGGEIHVEPGPPPRGGGPAAAEGTQPLYKTTVVIWSEYDGTQVELARLAREAESGGAYCSKSSSVLVGDPAADPDWDGTEFFDQALPEQGHDDDRA